MRAAAAPRIVITPVVAQAVVDRVISRLRLNVNIMGPDGVILASGDRSRVGDLHEGARRAVAAGTTVSLTAAQSRRLHGTRPGVNSPIELDGEIIGVVGVTGDPAEVSAAAASVVLTVELLLTQEQSQEERQWRDRARVQLVEDLVGTTITPADWDRRCRLLGLQLQPPYAVLAATLSAPLTPAQVGRQRDLGGPRVLAALDVADVLWVVAGSGHHQVARGAWAAAREQLRRSGVEAPTVDAGTAADLAELCVLVRRTRLATRAGVAADVSLRELELPVLLAALDPAVADGACQRLLGALDRDLLATVQALLDADLVVTRAAAALNLHRNTMLGRLERIRRLTGRDPRRFEDAAALHTGLLLHRAQARLPAGR